LRNAAKRRAFDVMQLLLRVTLAVSVALLSGCALLGFGPPTGIVEGTVFYADDGTPIAFGEVCVFGMDTTCVRADDKGHYRIRLPEQTMVLRFRAGQMPPAVSDTIRIQPPDRYQVDCGLQRRMVISDNPLPCQRPAGR